MEDRVGRSKDQFYLPASIDELEPSILTMPGILEQDSMFSNISARRNLLEEEDIAQKLGKPRPKPRPSLRRSETDFSGMPKRSVSSGPPGMHHRSYSFPEGQQTISNRTASKILDNRYFLGDEDIDFATKLLKKQFPNINGLYEVSVLAVEMGKPGKIQSMFKGEFIQILHTGNSHWVTVSNINCPSGSIKVFDSFYRNPLSNFLVNISKFVPTDGSLAFMLDIPKFQKQNFKGDCGLFAIASMVSLANGQDPSILTWDNSAMRGHLTQCLATNHLTVFPQNPGDDTDREDNYLPQKQVKIDLCCSCLLALTRADGKDKRITSCVRCEKKCHFTQNCVGSSGQPICIHCSS